jgi:hypothetical protein
MAMFCLIPTRVSKSLVSVMLLKNFQQIYLNVLQPKSHQALGRQCRTRARGGFAAMSNQLAINL